MAQGRVTQADLIVEQGGASANATQVDLIVELGPPEQARVTQIDLIVELGKPAEVRATQADLVYELVDRIYRPCVRIWYEGTEITGYTYGLDIVARAARRTVQTLCDTGALKWATMPAEWSLTLGGAWSAIVDGQLGQDIVDGQAYRRILIKIEIPPHNIIWYEWTRAQMLRYQIDSVPTQGVEWAAGIHFSSDPRRTFDC